MAIICILLTTIMACVTLTRKTAGDDYYDDGTTRAPDLQFINGLYIPYCIEPLDCPSITEYAPALKEDNSNLFLADGYVGLQGYVGYIPDFGEKLWSPVTLALCIDKCNNNPACTSVIMVFEPNSYGLSCSKFNAPTTGLRNTRDTEDRSKTFTYLRGLPKVDPATGSYRGFAAGCNPEGETTASRLKQIIEKVDADTCATHCTAAADCVAFEIRFGSAEAGKCLLYYFLCTDRRVTTLAFLFIKSGATLHPAGNIPGFISWPGDWIRDGHELPGSGDIAEAKGAWGYSVCAAKCLNHTDCIAFAWLPKHSVCSMTSRFTVGISHKQKLGGIGVAAFRKGLHQRPNTFGDCSTSPDEHNIRPLQQTDSVVACNALCGETRFCAAYMFETSSHACRLRETACAPSQFNVTDSRLVYGYGDFKSFDPFLYVTDIPWPDEELRLMFANVFVGKSDSIDVITDQPAAVHVVQCLQICRTDCGCMSAEFNFLNNKCQTRQTIFAPQTFDSPDVSFEGYPRQFTFFKGPYSSAAGDTKKTAKNFYFLKA